MEPLCAWGAEDSSGRDFLAEPVLFPIAFDGPGAYGSRWRTENSLTRVSTTTYGVPVFFRPPCDGCATELQNKLTLAPMSRSEGFLVWVLRGSEQYLAATSRIRDVSADFLATPFASSPTIPP